MQERDDWSPEAVMKLQPEQRHFAWLEHELRFHQDPVSQRLIKEIISMLRPGDFLEMQRKLEAAYMAIKLFRESV